MKPTGIFPGSDFGSVIFRGCLEADRPPPKKGLSYSPSRSESFVDIMIRFTSILPSPTDLKLDHFFEHGDIPSYLASLSFTSPSGGLEPSPWPCDRFLLNF